jgi:lysine 2,3-aminomutase
MKHLQGWISGVTRPNYASNIEGGGGKVLLMPSGHDTLNTGRIIDEKISESYATVYTWDNKQLLLYEALGRSTISEYDASVNIMEEFIGRKGVFLPKVIIIDEEGNHIETTNRTKLPNLEKFKKSELLNYETFEKEMPLTNPVKIKNILDKLYNESKKK